MLEALVAIFIIIGIVVLGVLLYILVLPMITKKRGRKQVETVVGRTQPSQNSGVQPATGGSGVPRTPPPPPPPTLQPQPRGVGVQPPTSPSGGTGGETLVTPMSGAVGGTPQPPSIPSGSQTMVSPVAQARGTTGGRVCSRCGTLNDPNAKYCKKCGTPLA
ncbi:hypothetical protein Pyrfu_1157 [Pyrolobus fumarii 1A]|uniref:DUF7577 domain-containing protein n=1 Tax=Pyrolobus fumarii (strain DSM 11204 / 1A) TaxID=694429 RepID=G0EFJ8_PYRF1|nr:hypothetical protein Pyrfu_1157 [Pyrolobus fumarii 1A]